MKRILALILVALMLMGLCACGNGEQSKEITKEMVNDYCNKFQYKEALEFANELYEQGKCDKEYLDSTKWICTIESLGYNLFAETINFKLKPNLKDPNSLTIYKIQFVAKGENIGVLLDYGATNSFGAMVRDKYVQYFIVNQSWIDLVNEVNSDINSDTVIDSASAFAEYFSKACFIFNADEAYSALTNKTATYDSYPAIFAAE